MQEALVAALDHQEAERFAKADLLYRRILAASPGHPYALHLWGILAALTGQPDEAMDRIRRAIAAAPDIADFHVNLARIEAALNRPDRAARLYANAVALQPEAVETRFQLAGLLQDLGRPAEAKEQYGALLTVAPLHASIHLNRALLREAQGRFAGARDGFCAALVLEPAHAKALLRLAAMERELGRGGAALAVQRQAMAVSDDPADAGLFSTLASLLAGEGLPEQAAEAARIAVALAPSDPALWNELANRLKGLGRIADSVAGYGRGLGLLPGGPGSLPRPMRRRIEDFAGRQPAFLKADPDWVAELRRRLEDGRGDGRRLVGLSWSSKNAAVGHLRSIPLGRLAKALERPDVRLVSLQYGDVAAEVAAADVADPGLDAWSDIDGLAALIAAMDLVVSVDNSTVHLAGGLGRPAWALLPHAADWRWMQGRHDTVWYPSVRLFRQDRAGEWDGVLRDLREALDPA
ncbi:hypothetical protein TSH7_17560 [Azospirillum sp. TSH7]|nr:hypothetical protein TSH7_17560 [Azospirillum sp. TSH7]PWC62817.1 hypothetical protein TSH20_21205 [Azospirillum sp. TSH20]